MTTKADFNAEEWSTVTEGPLLAGMSVVAATRGGTLRETLAIGKTYAEARRRQAESPLLDEIVSAAPTPDTEQLRSGGDIGRLASERLRQAVGLLAAKATAEDVDAYRRFVLDVAEAAANAHREGGLLGVGGKQVSDDEQAALDRIAESLEVPPSGGTAPGGPAAI
jgi:hypothetical protein